MLKLRFGLSLLLCTSTVSAQTTKAAADQLCHQLRTLQRPDGGYGNDLAETCRVLDVLGRSPRRYTELDGPFIRDAARLVQQAPSGTVPDALVALALAGAVSAELRATRDAALARLEADPRAADFDSVLALRTLRPALVVSEPAVAVTDPAFGCLLAADPASVAPPPTAPTDAWTRWARAARLRGIKPVELPELPAPGKSAAVMELVQALETVIQMHGLHQPAVPAALAAGAGGDTTGPVRVAAGQTLDAALERVAAFFDREQKGGTFGLGTPGWQGSEPGVTALCLSAAMSVADLRHQERPAWTGAGLDYLRQLQHDDGSIREEGLDVYTTSVAIEALVLGGRPGDREAIDRANRFLLVAQADEGEGYQSSTDIYYGGIGYGNDERPDLSNTQFALGAASAAGTPRTDPFFLKARIFIERCQNLSERGAVEWSRAAGGRLVMGNDGGGTYMPGNSEAGEVKLADGVYQAVSYGSMTYALVKSYLFCDLSPDDARVKAAVRWLARNFSLDRNPGFAKAEAGSDGLFYYYLAMARTLRMLPENGFVDERGEPIPWRESLTRRLLDTQRTDGSWTNEGSTRWWENAPTLCSAYAALSLTASAN